ncbi:MAG: CAAD domain-containing protein [Cyanobacteriota bacterium]|nr:CAAD domain-containing protein [Cyanobacteriota bacterium]
MQQPDPSKTTTSETVIDTETPEVEVEVQVTPPPEETNSQFQGIKTQAVEILAELPVILSRFFNQYRKPIITVGLILAVGVGIKVTLAVIDALNDIPLLAPTFELIGIIYSGWFVYRYLLRASNREELWAEVQSLKEQLLGDKAVE